MPCPDEVIKWFRQLDGAKRVELVCGLLHMCVPFELRFLGTCVEELAKRDYQELRDAECRANSIAHVTSLQARGGLSDDHTRRRLSIYLALLSSANQPCSAICFQMLCTLPVELWDLLYDSSKRGCLLAELQLLYAIASHHPAFTFEQKLSLRQIAYQLTEFEEKQEDGAKSEETPSVDLIAPPSPAKTHTPPIIPPLSPTPPPPSPPPPPPPPPLPAHPLSVPLSIPMSLPLPLPLSSQSAEVEKPPRQVVAVELVNPNIRKSDDKHEYHLHITCSDGVTLGKRVYLSEITDFHRKLLSVSVENNGSSTQWLPTFPATDMPHPQSDMENYFNNLLANCPQQILHSSFFNKFFTQGATKCAKTAVCQGGTDLRPSLPSFVVSRSNLRPATMTHVQGNPSPNLCSTASPSPSDASVSSESMVSPNSNVRLSAPVSSPHRVATPIFSPHSPSTVSTSNTPNTSTITSTNVAITQTTRATTATANSINANPNINPSTSPNANAHINPNTSPNANANTNTNSTSVSEVSVEPRVIFRKTRQRSALQDVTKLPESNVRPLGGRESGYVQLNLPLAQMVTASQMTVARSVQSPSLPSTSQSQLSSVAKQCGTGDKQRTTEIASRFEHGPPAESASQTRKDEKMVNETTAKLEVCEPQLVRKQVNSGLKFEKKEVGSPENSTNVLQPCNTETVITQPNDHPIVTPSPAACTYSPAPSLQPPAAILQPLPQTVMLSYPFLTSTTSSTTPGMRCTYAATQQCFTLPKGIYSVVQPPPTYYSPAHQAAPNMGMMMMMSGQPPTNQVERLAGGECTGISSSSGCASASGASSSSASGSCSSSTNTNSCSASSGSDASSPPASPMTSPSQTPAPKGTTDVANSGDFSKDASKNPSKDNKLSSEPRAFAHHRHHHHRHVYGHGRDSSGRSSSDEGGGGGCGCAGRGRFQTPGAGQSTVMVAPNAFFPPVARRPYGIIPGQKPVFRRENSPSCSNGIPNVTNKTDNHQYDTPNQNGLVDSHLPNSCSTPPSHAPSHSAAHCTLTYSPRFVHHPPPPQALQIFPGFPAGFPPPAHSTNGFLPTPHPHSHPAMPPPTHTFPFGAAPHNGVTPELIYPPFPPIMSAAPPHPSHQPLPPQPPTSSQTPPNSGNHTPPFLPAYHTGGTPSTVPTVSTSSAQVPIPYQPVLFNHPSRVVLPPPVGTKMTCYNCGQFGHVGTECKEASMEEVVKPGQYHLNYAHNSKAGESRTDD